MKSTIWINWKTFSVAASLLLASWAGALDITVRLPAATEVEVWVLAKAPDQSPVAGRRFKSAQFPLPIPKELETGVIVVSDAARNAVAMTTIAALEGAVWQIRDKDWKILRLDVSVFTRGATMPGGTVEAQSGAFHQTQSVENGKVQFFAVPVGTVQFVVHYQSGGAAKKTAPEERNVKLVTPQESIALTVTDLVDGGSTPSQGAAKQEEQSPPIANLLLIAAGMGIVLGGLYIVLRYLVANQEKTQIALRKLGVDPITPPKDDEPVQTPVQLQPLVPEGHCEFCGKPLGECICSKTAPAASTNAVATVPHLTGDGMSFDVRAGGTIGREGDFVINDPTVSRKHAELRADNGTLIIKDLGSSNGTFINGVRIDDETNLAPGDTVQFGAVKLRYEG